MTNQPDYFEIWENILSAIRDRIREHGISAQELEIIDQPARTVVIKTKKLGGGSVQASISLQGDSIDIKRQPIAEDQQASDAPEVIEIEVRNGVVAYIHDDIDRTTDPRKVAEIILNPILDVLPRAKAQRGKT